MCSVGSCKHFSISLLVLCLFFFAVGIIGLTHIHVKIFYGQLWNKDFRGWLVALQGTLEDEVLLEPKRSSMHIQVRRESCLPKERVIFFVETWFPPKRKESVRAGQGNLSHWQNPASPRCFSPRVHKSLILTTKSEPADIATLFYSFYILHSYQ